MNYIENIFICLAAPLLVTVFCVRGRTRVSLLFVLAGMFACLLSSYVSTYLALVNGADAITASMELAPVVEEGMKLFPMLFYLLVFEPRKEEAADEALLIAVGFATFENVCYLTTNGASDIAHLLVRGFGAGAMHVVCGMMVAAGLVYLWDRLYLRLAGTFALFCLAVTFHAVYNVLVSQSGAAAFAGYLIPVATAAVVLPSLRRLRQG